MLGADVNTTDQEVTQEMEAVQQADQAAEVEGSQQVDQAVQENDPNDILGNNINIEQTMTQLVNIEEGPQEEAQQTNQHIPLSDQVVKKIDKSDTPKPSSGIVKNEFIDAAVKEVETAKSELEPGAVQIIGRVKRNFAFLFSSKFNNVDMVINSGPVATIYNAGKDEFKIAQEVFFNKLKFDSFQNAASAQKAEQVAEGYHITTRKRYDCKSGAFESDYTDYQSVKAAMTKLMERNVPSHVNENTLTVDDLPNTETGKAPNVQIIDNNKASIDSPDSNEGFKFGLDSKSLFAFIHPINDFTKRVTQSCYIQNDKLLYDQLTVWKFTRCEINIDVEDESMPAATYKVYTITSYDISKRQNVALSVKPNHNDPPQLVAEDNKQQQTGKRKWYYNNFDLQRFSSTAFPAGIVVEPAPEMGDTTQFEEKGGSKPLLNSLWILQDIENKPGCFVITPFRWMNKYALTTVYPEDKNETPYLGIAEVPDRDVSDGKIYKESWAWSLEPYDDEVERTAMYSIQTDGIEDESVKDVDLLRKSAEENDACRKNKYVQRVKDGQIVMNEQETSWVEALQESQEESTAIPAEQSVQQVAEGEQQTEQVAEGEQQTEQVADNVQQTEQVADNVQQVDNRTETYRFHPARTIRRLKNKQREGFLQVGDVNAKVITIPDKLSFNDKDISDPMNGDAKLFLPERRKLNLSAVPYLYASYSSVKPIYNISVIKIAPHTNLFIKHRGEWGSIANYSGTQINLTPETPQWEQLFGTKGELEFVDSLVVILNQSVPIYTEPTWTALNIAKNTIAEAFGQHNSKFISNRTYQLVKNVVIALIFAIVIAFALLLYFAIRDNPLNQSSNEYDSRVYNKLTSSKYW